MRISSSPRIVYWALACVWIVAGWHGASALPQGPDGTDRVTALQVFTAQTERYVRPRARFEEQLPSFDARRDPWSLMLTRGYLASAIRTARSYAHQGDVFTPPAAAMFRDQRARSGLGASGAFRTPCAAGCPRCLTRSSTESWTGI